MSEVTRYFLIEEGVVILKSYPFVEGWIEGPDYAAPGYLYAEGEFGSPSPPLPSDTDTSAAFEHAIQNTLDTAAIAARYENIASAVSYAEEPAVPKFQNEGIAFRAWRSKVWAYAYEQLALVLAGVREQPTVEAFLLELPALEFPA